MEVSTTIRGKPSCHYEGYSYTVKKTKEDGTVIWRCSKQKEKHCRGKLQTKDSAVLFSHEHQCGAPDDARLEVQRTLNQAKKRAREENTSISKIYSEELGTLHNRGYDFVTEMPEQRTTKRTLYKQRAKSQGSERDPDRREEIELRAELLTMNDGSSFLLSDDKSGDRIIVFCGIAGRDALRSKRDFFMDGTFKCCSKQFSQIYTIHADFGSNKNETNIYPVAFAFLPNKRKETYIRLFRNVLENIPEWNPASVTVDFESAAISAIIHMFPTSSVHGCYFHMRKSLWRKVQDLGLTREYKENEEVRQQIRMCAALAFLRPEDVCDGWLEIHSQAPDVPRLSDFFDYFVERWLENEENPISLWSCYKRLHRTTNSVEGWHNKINNMLSKPNPKISDVITCMKTEAENSACALMRAELSMAGKRKKTVYMKQDERLEKILKKYEEDGEIRACLKAISYLQKLD